MAAADGDVADERCIGAGIALGEVPSVPLGERVDRFWQASAPLPVRPQTFDNEPDLLLRQLPQPGSAIGGEALVAALREGYGRFNPPPSG